jgi:hypothetical protein
VSQNLKLLMPEQYRGEHDGDIADYVCHGPKKIIDIGRGVSGRRKDGTTFPLHLSASAFEADGRRRYFTGMIHDLSEADHVVALRDILGHAAHRRRCNRLDPRQSPLSGDLLHKIHPGPFPYAAIRSNRCSPGATQAAGTATKLRGKADRDRSSDIALCGRRVRRPYGAQKGTPHAERPG